MDPEENEELPEDDESLGYAGTVDSLGEPEPEMPSEPPEDDEEDGANVQDYWAASIDEDTLGAELVERVNSYDRYVERKGLLEGWKRSWRTYYSLGEDDGDAAGFGRGVMFGGKQGELSLIDANHYRTLARRIITLTTENRPAIEARATNTDPKSVAQTHIARGVMEYYLREERLEESLIGVLERAVVFTEGYLVETWDANAGGMDEDGQPMGDVRVRAYAPMDIIRDWSRTPRDQQWYIVRDYANKHDLAAQYPRLRDEILGVSDDLLESSTDEITEAAERGRDSDTIAVYWFYHDKSPAIPNGRYAFFLPDGTIMHKDSLPYEEKPVYRCAPAELLGSAFGYSDMFSLIGLQEMYNGLLSTISTIYDAFGNQDVVVEKGTDIDEREIAGMNIFRIQRGAMVPQALALAKPPEGGLEFLGFLSGVMEILSGVNPVARGNMDAIGKSASGSFVALIQTMAVQANSALQSSFARLIEDAGTGLINILKTYANKPRMAMIAGEDNRHYMASFTGDDLSLVTRVVADTGNPMKNTHAGRMEIIELLGKHAAPGEITIGQILQVLATGNMHLFTGPYERQMDLINSENSALTKSPQITTTQLAGPDGEMVDMPQVVGVSALITDDHELHARHHDGVLNSPEARQDQGIVAAVLAHKQEHDFLRAVQMARENPPPPPDPNAGPPPGPPMDDGGPPPGATPDGMPSGPTDPMTGEQFPVEGLG